jgi:O-antigen/teichoic acid export membrane protein
MTDRRFKIHLVANFTSSGWSTLMQLVFIPLYIKLLGIESFGLIGFYITLQMVLQVLDFGLSPTINREMARYSVLPDKAEESRDLVRTLEAYYWCVSLLIGIGMFVLAPAIATSWIRSGTLPSVTVVQAVVLMGILAAFQWPLSLYQGGLLGLQRQSLVSGLNIFTTTLSNGGAVLVLWFVSPTITAFFLWKILIGILQIGLNTFFLWRSLPASRQRARFEFRRIRNIWRFSAGMSGIAISAIVITQADKVILSKLLTLEKFGYYMLACTVANGLNLLVTPVINAIFPRFSALIATGDEDALKKLYRSSTQLLAVIILPCAVFIVLFSREILLLWTHNASAADHATLIVSVMAIGTAINSLMCLPYTLQVASGWTRLGLKINMVLIAAMIPAISFMTIRFGAMGAAIVWTSLNVSYMSVGVWLTHRRLLIGETKTWFENVMYPLSGILAVALAGRWIFDHYGSSTTIATTLLISGIFLVSVLAAIASSQATRTVLVRKLRVLLAPQ